MPSTAPRAPSGSWSSRPGPGPYDVPDPDLRCAANTAPHGAAPRRKPAPASPGYGRFALRGLQELQPLLVGGDPREFGQPRDQATLMTAEPAARRVAATADRVGLMQALLD